MDREMLTLPCDVAVRRIALGFLDDASAAARRVDRPDPDVEALHDLRVALRRLRSTLRAWPDLWRGTLRQRHVRRLRKVTRATGEARDLEVVLALLDELGGAMNDAQQRGAAMLRAELDRRLAVVRQGIRRDVLPRWERLAPRLRDGLSVVLRSVDAPDREPPSFAAALAGGLRRAGREVAEAIDAVGGLEDQDAAHAARIAIKRLRYLVEPVRDALPAARALVDRCRAAQDALGRMHDAHVLLARVEHALGDAAADRARSALHAVTTGEPDESPDPRGGLLELGQRAHALLRASWERCRQELFDEGGRRWREEAFALAEALEAVAHGRASRDEEIERKYLLSRLPEMPHADVVEIEQGYLPGDRIVERLRRERAPRGVRLLRTVKLGGGVRRVEIEEPVGAELFEALWPLTSGRRIHKRRHRVVDGARTWEIDEFLDRSLVLAEVELTRSDEEVALPAWLEPFVLRDVTDDPEYLNVRLAR
ncbi:MAG: CHAD domain-containing protein [Myxococcota bacterium]|nr:CHAD domain-containing protein [Myxococcota bacterium]MDW8363534.1 CHAD domain-containing protein [Myxococcales bacterium]